MKNVWFSLVLLGGLLFGGNVMAQNGYQKNPEAKHTFAIGKSDFLLDNEPFVIRCGEMHFARIPREYWAHRLKMARAMGLNTVCAYLFWNYHEQQEGKFTWDGMADAAEFCRLAQKEGLLVILRPGPYACAEWDMGGLPWWLLRYKDIKVRTQDPVFMAKSRTFLEQVGRQLAPLQITKGGPIVLVQVENEYGFYGNDRDYLGRIRDILKEVGFDVPLFTCDAASEIKKTFRDDIFCAVNFGSNPESCFKTLREVRPEGPLMCSEFYPGWFDSWGRSHHLGNGANILKDLDYMLKNRASFSVYMAHGGTSFDYWAGANCPPYKPQTSSYDYDAPISEAGWITPRFNEMRELFAANLNSGENIPEAPAAMPVMSLPAFKMSQMAPLISSITKTTKPVLSPSPLTFEEMNFGFGAAVYSTTLSAGAASELVLEKDVHDFAHVYLNQKRIGTFDRTTGVKRIKLPALASSARLDLVVESMGRVNFGSHLADRKGLNGKVFRRTGEQDTEVQNWKTYPMDIANGYPRNLAYGPAHLSAQPAFYKGKFRVTRKADLFLDMSKWGKGMVWVNGHGLGRFWNIGPTQTMYLPAPWLKVGENEIVILDYLTPKSLTVSGLKTPILDKLTFADVKNKYRKKGQSFADNTTTMVHQGQFLDSKEWQMVRFDKPATGRFFCIEALSSQYSDPNTTLAELYLIDQNGKELPRGDWKIAYTDSQETRQDDGKADNIFDMQHTTFWHTEWSEEHPAHPHQVIVDLQANTTVAGFKYLPRQDSPNGRIKNFKIYISQKPFKGL